MPAPNAPAEMKIVLPNNWEPRVDQLPFWSALESGKKRAIILGHRRWG